jgi:1-deoxy-D-xylulose-5-phosphate reductoisomerase
MVKRLTILGSTGSIGRNTLEIVDRFKTRFAVTALAARANLTELAAQIERFRPQLAVVYTEQLARELASLLPPATTTEIAFGLEGYCRAAVHPDADTVVAAMVGAAGLQPALAAIEAGKRLALANKETLVMAGDIVTRAAARLGVEILPIDSEHSAIFQCLQGSRRSDLDRILLTGSGGPFRRTPHDAFDRITADDALRHPNWQMGPKISIDSATLMNKGLEVIEARWLFGLERRNIEVLIHPQSIVHSMVAYRDGSVLAQLGVPDMKTAIAYALSVPARLALDQPVPDFTALGRLDFEAPDLTRFPCLQLAFEACDEGQTLPAVLNAANEQAVAAFLVGRLAFTGIAPVVAQTLEAHQPVGAPTLQDILEADRWARGRADAEIAKRQTNG